MLRLGGAFFLNPRCPLSRCRNEKESGARSPHSISPRLVVIRLIRVIRGLNILSFQLQNHSTSLMPIRVIEATERIARKKAECARRSVSFISAYSNAFTGSVQSVKIRFSVSSVFYFYQTARHKYRLASCTCGTPFDKQTVLPNSNFLCASAPLRESSSIVVIHKRQPDSKCSISHLLSVTIRVLRFIRVLLLPNNSRTQQSRVRCADRFSLMFDDENR